MPIVFIHGVNTRKQDPGYDATVWLIEKFCIKHLTGATLSGKTLTTAKPRFPYWGDLASKFAWNMASLPSGEINALGAASVEEDLRPLIAMIGDGLVDPESAKQQPLLTLAHKSLSQAVAAITSLLLHDARPADAEHTAQFIVAAQGYAEDNPAPAWLAGLSTDAQFVNTLVAEVGSAGPTGVQALGTMDFIVNPLTAAVMKVKQAVSSAAGSVLNKTGDYASTKLLAWSRQPLNGILGRFFGDVFIYLDERQDNGAPGPINQLLLHEFKAAVAAGPQGEPLVLIGHSLGGVITFDLLSHFCPDIEVDLLVSVGSQVSHFEELKLFKESDKAVPSATQGRAKKPANIKRWINIFDEVDIFSYACDKVFEDVIDFHYDTKTYVVKAHGAYLEQERFYRRLRERIDQL